MNRNLPKCPDYQETPGSLVCTKKWSDQSIDQLDAVAAELEKAGWELGSVVLRGHVDKLPMIRSALCQAIAHLDTFEKAQRAN